MSTCRHCGSEAVYELRASGHWLCKRHFKKMIESRVKKNIRQMGLIEKDDNILVGVSGGKDSMSALKLLSDITGPRPDIRLSALSVAEGIKGKSIKHVKKYCEDKGIQHHVLSFRDAFGFGIDDVIDKIMAQGILACSVCGVLKRRIINDYATENSYTKVATGHNLDDEIQSAFMNFARGELERMARLGAEVGVARHPGFVPRIKILRPVLEEEVKLYADLSDIPYTKSMCPYSKTSYRSSAKYIIDELERRHPGSKRQMLASTDELIEIMREHAQGGPRQCIRCAQPSSGQLCKTCMLLETLS